MNLRLLNNSVTKKKKKKIVKQLWKTSKTMCQVMNKVFFVLKF